MAGTTISDAGSRMPSFGAAVLQPYASTDTVAGVGRVRTSAVAGAVAHQEKATGLAGLMGGFGTGMRTDSNAQTTDLRGIPPRGPAPA